MNPQDQPQVIPPQPGQTISGGGDPSSAQDTPQPSADAQIPAQQSPVAPTSQPLQSTAPFASAPLPGDSSPTMSVSPSPNSQIPSPNLGVTNLTPSSKKSLKLSQPKPIFIAMITGAFILILIIFTIGYAVGRSSAPKAPEAEPVYTGNPEGPQPATAIDVERINNSISQDITKLNDDADFTLTEFTNDALGL